MTIRGQVFAYLYDRLMEEAEEAGLGEMRRELLSSASGRVLEIGGGTGASLPYYGKAVTELVITEPEEPMARKLAAKLRTSAMPAKVVLAPAEQLPFEAARFDCVVSSLVLCTVTDPVRALAEVRRVLKPGGRLLLMEHVRGQDVRTVWWQDRLRLPWYWLAYGCQINRPTRRLLQDAGFSVGGISDGEFPKAPFFVRPMIVGEARR